MKIAFILMFFGVAWSGDFDKGKAIYTSKCISCHNKDPRIKGNVGPDIADSNMSLLILKTQHRKYPEGYAPKRKTKIMPKIPMTDAQLVDLYEYISSFNKGK